MTSSEHLLPEGEFQLWNNLRGESQISATSFQAGTTYRFESPREGFIPRPTFAINGFQGLGHSVADRDFADMQGEKQRARNLSVPCVEGKCSLGIASPML